MLLVLLPAGRFSQKFDVMLTGKFTVHFDGGGCGFQPLLKLNGSGKVG